MTGRSGADMSPATTQAAVPSSSTRSSSSAMPSNASTARLGGTFSHFAKCCGVAGPYAWR